MRRSIVSLCVFAVAAAAADEPGHCTGTAKAFSVAPSYGAHRLPRTRAIRRRLRAYSTKTGGIVWDFDAKRDFDTVNKVPAKGGSFNGAGPAISRGMVIRDLRLRLRGRPGGQRAAGVFGGWEGRRTDRQRRTGLNRQVQIE
jgi:hypothetical protein